MAPADFNPPSLEGLRIGDPAPLPVPATPDSEFYIVPDEWLSQEAIVASHKHFTHILSQGSSPAVRVRAYEAVVAAIRSPYVIALTMAEMMYAKELAIARMQDETNIKVQEAKMANQLERLQSQVSNDRKLLESEMASKRTLLESELAKQKALLESDLAKEKALLESKIASERTRLASETTLLESELANEKALLELKLANEKNRIEREKEIYEIKLKGLNNILTDDREKHTKELERLEAKVTSTMQEINNLRNIKQTGSPDNNGSVSRRNLWKIAIENGTMNQILPRPSSVGVISDNNIDVQTLLNTSFRDEVHMYGPTTVAFRNLLNRHRTDSDPGVMVYDTHAKRIFGDYKPDICICLGESTVPDAASIYVTVELKHHPHPMDNEDYGQVLDYLIAMRQHQNGRRVFVALLSTLHVNHIILLRIHSNGEQLIHYKSVSLASALTYIKQVSLTQGEYIPPMPAFSLGLGIMEGRLGTAANTVVGKFNIPPVVLANLTREFPREVKDFGTMMAVKTSSKPASKEFKVDSATDDIKQEIAIYHLIEEFRKQSPCSQISHLIYESPDRDELGIFPVGEPINTQLISDASTLITILDDVLTGLAWLHDHGIIHRDIRRANIIVVTETDHLYRCRQRGRIIDFGASVALKQGQTRYESQKYVGGYICCPPEVIGNFSKEYTPSPTHDYLAWVMMVNCLVFPNGVLSMTSARVMNPGSSECNGLQSYWRKMRDSKYWSRWVDAAERADVAELRDILNHFVVVLGNKD